MRFFISTVIASVALILSADAAAISLDKRAAANVEACVVNINGIGTQIDAFQPVMQGGSIIDTTTQYGRLHDAITAAQSSCCAINTAISDADANYYLDVFNAANTKAINFLSLAAQKAKDFSFFSKLAIVSQVNDLRSITDSLDTCFGVFTPDAEKARLQGYLDAQKAAFTSTKAAYNF